MSPEAFYGMTVHELSMLLRGYNDKRERELHQLKWAVWHVAALQRSKDFPKFASFTGTTPKSASISKDEQKAELGLLIDMFAVPPGEEGNEYGIS